MADTTQTLLSVTLTKNERLSQLPISDDSQMIFVKDLRTIALDYHGKRTFYNNIQTVETEVDRQNLTPENGVYYFVVETVLLWTYQNGWIQITQNMGSTVYIGINKPSTGEENILYADTTNQNVAVWDKESNGYIIVGEKTKSISNDEILKLFN